MRTSLAIQARSLAVLGLTVAMVGMLTVYFGEFEQGAIVGGGLWRGLAKIAAIALLALALIATGVRGHVNITALTFIHVIFFLSTIVLIATTSQVPRDFQWANFHIGVLTLWLSYSLQKGDGRAGLLFTLPLIVALVLSFCFDAYAFVSGRSLWENGAFIGTMGNPSTFGFVCVIGIAYCSPLPGIRRLLLSGILCVLAIATQSLFAVLLSISLFMIINRRAGYWLLPAIVIFAVQITNMLIEMHFFYKLTSAAEFLSGDTGGSASVTTRVEFIADMLGRMADHPSSLLFGHPDGAPYLSGDAGWISLTVSYGLILVLLYGATIAVSLAQVSRYSAEEKICRLVCLVFVAFMLVNRIHDYWPIALVFYWHLGELIARKENRFESLHGAGARSEKDADGSAVGPDSAWVGTPAV